MPNEADDWQEVHQDDWQEVPQKTPPRPKKTALESAISGTADMLTLGHSDEIAAGLRAGVSAPFAKENFGSLYDQALNDQRQHKAQSEEDNPGSYLAGNVVGAAIPALATGGASVAEESPSLFAKAYGAIMPSAERGTMANIGRGALGGAILGSGNSNARPTDSLDKAEEYATDVAGGAALGGATAGIADKLGRMVSGVNPSNFRRMAGDRAVKAATGQNRAAITAMRRSGTASEVGNALESAGNIIQRADEAGAPVVQAGDRAEDILPKAMQKQKFFGNKIGEVAGVIDQTMPKAVDAKKIANRIVDYAAKLPETEETMPIINRLQREAVRIESKGQMDFSEAQKLKNAYKFSPVDPTKQKFGQEASNELNKIFRTEMNDTAKQLSELTSDPTKKMTLDQYLSWKDKYQAYKNVANAAQKRVDANLSNRFVSPSDYGTGMAGMMMAGAQGVGPLKSTAIALASGAANKVARERGSSVASAAYRNMANVLEKSPQALGRFGGLLEAASRRGPAALLVTHQKLMQEPEYRTIVQPPAEEP